MAAIKFKIRLICSNYYNLKQNLLILIFSGIRWRLRQEIGRVEFRIEKFRKFEQTEIRTGSRRRRATQRQVSFSWEKIGKKSVFFSYSTIKKANYLLSEMCPLLDHVFDDGSSATTDYALKTGNNSMKTVFVLIVVALNVSNIKRSGLIKWRLEETANVRVSFKFSLYYGFSIQKRQRLIPKKPYHCKVYFLIKNLLLSLPTNPFRSF